MEKVFSIFSQMTLARHSHRLKKDEFFIDGMNDDELTKEQKAWVKLVHEKLKSPAHIHLGENGLKEGKTRVLYATEERVSRLPKEESGIVVYPIENIDEETDYAFGAMAVMGHGLVAELGRYVQNEITDLNGAEMSDNLFTAVQSRIADPEIRNAMDKKSLARMFLDPNQRELLKKAKSRWSLGLIPTDAIIAAARLAMTTTLRAA